MAAQVYTSVLLPEDKELLIDGRQIYLWNINSSERERLDKFIPNSNEWLSGTYLYNTRNNCEGCGKHTEFVDFVHTAMKKGIHSIEFIINSLKDLEKTPSPPHAVDCSQCEKTYPIMYGWAGTGTPFNWQAPPPNNPPKK